MLRNFFAARLAEASVVRNRPSLSAFFGWCAQEKLITMNPVTGVPVPRQSKEATEMQPFSEAELEREPTGGGERATSTWRMCSW